MAERIQRKRTKGWRAPQDAVNVTRGSDWGNPYRVGDLLECGSTELTLIITPELAVSLFEAYCTERGWLDQIRQELRGKTLMCYCPVGQPCHADWLMAIANQEAQR